MSEKASFDFSDEDTAIVKCLAGLLERAELNMFSISAVQERTELDEETVRNSCRLLANLGYLSLRDIDGNNFSIEKSIFVVRHAIENPPLPNHWKDLIDWWFSKRWSLPVTALVVVLPLVAQWVEMLKTVAEWVTSTG